MLCHRYGVALAKASRPVVTHVHPNASMACFLCCNHLLLFDLAARSLTYPPAGLPLPLPLSARCLGLAALKTRFHLSYHLDTRAVEKMSRAPRQRALFNPDVPRGDCVGAAGLCLGAAAVVGLSGRNVFAKKLTVLASFMASCFALITALEDSLQVLRFGDVGKILVGLSHGVRLDVRCDGVAPAQACADMYGLDTAQALVVVHYLDVFIWLALAIHMWRETHFILGSFCIMSAVGCVQLLLVSLHQQLASPGVSYLAIACLIFQAVWYFFERRTRARVKEIMRADQEFYEEWFARVLADDGHRRTLKQLRREVALISDKMNADGADNHWDRNSRSWRGSAHDGTSVFPPEEGSGSLEEDSTASERRVGIACPGLCGVMPQQWAEKQGDGGAEAWQGKVSGTRVRQMLVAPPAITDVQALSEYQAMLFENRIDAFVNVSNSIRYPRRFFSMRTKSQHQGGMLQICTSLDSLYQQARCLRPILQKKVEQHVGATPNASRIGGTLQTPLKDPLRAVEKCHRVYGDDASLLLDVCRELLVFQDLTDLLAMVKRLRQDPELIIVRIKNRLDPEYNSENSAGYRDVLVNVRIENHESIKLNVKYHVAELQLIPRDVYERRCNDVDDARRLGHRGAPSASTARVADSLEGQDIRPNGHRNYVVWRNLRGR